jgi:hypothetical protein
MATAVRLQRTFVPLLNAECVLALVCMSDMTCGKALLNSLECRSAEIVCLLARSGCTGATMDTHRSTSPHTRCRRHTAE